MQCNSIAYSMKTVFSIHFADGVPYRGISFKNNLTEFIGGLRMRRCRSRYLVLGNRRPTFNLPVHSSSVAVFDSNVVCTYSDEIGFSLVGEEASESVLADLEFEITLSSSTQSIC